MCGRHSWFLVILASFGVRRITGLEKASAAQNVTRVLSNILFDYDQQMRPGWPAFATRVVVDIDVLGIGNIDEKNMEFSVHCYFRQKWRDQRLQFDFSNEPKNVSHVTIQKRVLPLNAQRVLAEIWRPDTYIRNGKHSFLHKLTVPNRLLRIRSDGTILLSQRLTITARCLMQLKKFPMDKQKCTLEIGSLGHSSQEVVYQWHGIRKSGFDLEMSQFTLGSIQKAHRNVSSVSHFGEQSSILIAQFHLIRQQGYYVLQIYVPCSMIVVLSWVSFWINKGAAIARCSLGVTTVLTLTTLRLGVREELPVVDYATAIDIFLFVSFGFVMAALVEYIVIHFSNLMQMRKDIRIYTRKIRLINVLEDTNSVAPAGVIRKQAKTQQVEMLRRKITQMSQSLHPGADSEETGPAFEFLTDAKKIAQVDLWAKIVFPGTYLLFHLTYWYSYIFWIKD